VSGKIPMDKVYDQAKTEEKWYKFWEESGFFKPEINPKGEPYTIILPPPNANANLHFGHAMMSIEDILIRFKRMQGYSTLWLPGSDHAGFETQVVFEKKLQEEGKSRFDFDRETLYKMIWDYVQSNKSNMENQLRRLGFSVDWSREKFTLDPDIIEAVYKTFKLMFDGGLVYRDNRLVNYCTKHGTGFSDLEVNYEERTTPLYFIKYGPLTLATVRLETKFGDTAVAVNPKDPRYSDFVGKEIEIETVLGKTKLKVIADEAVDPEFGTGVIKVTPAHSQVDFEIGKRHNLELKQVIGYDGRLNDMAGKFAGMRVKEARATIAEEMQQKGLIEKVDMEYKNRVGVCYKCGTEIEPLPLEQWFMNVQDLKKMAIEAVKSGKIKIFPKNFENIYFQWMEGLRDWNISRQNIWGIRIPAFFDKTKNQWLVEIDPKKQEELKNDPNFEQDSDTFDTWFSSGQWPYITLQTTRPGDFEKFYPTSVMETGYDILRAWVSRMIMLGLEVTKTIPFHDVVLHGLVLDPLGKKMSKSKGNVVSPMEIVDQYGADAARMALVYGTATGHDQILSHPKLQAMRNFSNKLWNIGRFIIEFKPEGVKSLEADQTPKPINKDDKEVLEKLKITIEKVTGSLDQYRFHDGSDALYEFIWHEFADKYIEKAKTRREESQKILEYVFKSSLELLHPFMPFITEELWQKLPHEGDSIMITKWPS
jgi:valyl-tRNA synthetase